MFWCNFFPLKNSIVSFFTVNSVDDNVILWCQERTYLGTITRLYSLWPPLWRKAFPWEFTKSTHFLCQVCAALLETITLHSVAWSFSLVSEAHIHMLVMAWWIEDLLCRYENLSLNPKNQCKARCNSVCSGRQENPWKLWDYKVAKALSLSVAL